MTNISLCCRPIVEMWSFEWPEEYTQAANLQDNYYRVVNNTDATLKRLRTFRDLRRGGLPAGGQHGARLVKKLTISRYIMAVFLVILVNVHASRLN